ncbi:MAG: hypothetical protein AAGB26_12455 [Planctomycetota bacterium]
MDATNDALLDWREGIPYLTGSFEESNSAVDQWLNALDQALDGCFVGKAAMPGLSVLSTQDNDLATLISQHAHRCRSRLLSLAGGDAFSGLPADIVILHFREMSEYYRYIEAFFPEGEFGGSAGIQIRSGYPHIAVWGEAYQGVGVIAHEMLHLAVMHRELPIWIDEGLAQMFEVDMGSGSTLTFEQQEIQACREFWLSNDIQLLWQGEGFQGLEDVQKYSYMMAEMLMRNLAERYGKRSFFKRNRETAFVRFISTAHYEDSGDEAANKELGVSLSEIAAQFIGPPR